MPVKADNIELAWQSQNAWNSELGHAAIGYANPAVGTPDVVDFGGLWEDGNQYCHVEQILSDTIHDELSFGLMYCRMLEHNVDSS